jgi:hypothetical protein
MSPCELQTRMPFFFEKLIDLLMSTDSIDPSCRNSDLATRLKDLGPLTESARDNEYALSRRLDRRDNRRDLRDPNGTRNGFPIPRMYEELMSPSSISRRLDALVVSNPPIKELRMSITSTKLSCV